ncbi:hypothetical protein [Streptomyces sp. NPDC018352]|uniref:hypothetical protein n=1 Tax=Streptomyces sp. NPDC018352 TaxID=3157194 RepID=UPI00340EBEDF
MWTTAALLGQRPLPPDSARRVAELLDLPRCSTVPLADRACFGAGAWATTPAGRPAGDDLRDSSQVRSPTTWWPPPAATVKGLGPGRGGPGEHILLPQMRWRRMSPVPYVPRVGEREPPRRPRCHHGGTNVRGVEHWIERPTRRCCRR